MNKSGKYKGDKNGAEHRQKYGVDNHFVSVLILRGSRIPSIFCIGSVVFLLIASLVDFNPISNFKVNQL